jgi:hypothetical protein
VPVRWNNLLDSLTQRSKALVQEAGRSKLLLSAMAVAVGVALLACLVWPAPSDEPTHSAQPAASSDPLAELRTATNESNIWQSQADRDRRWQLARMAMLGRLLSDFAAVDRATVFLEPGTPGGLGRQAQPPRAVVTVHLAADADFTASLLTAIADQVAGAVTGLNRQAVRVIDTHGGSYCLADDLGALATREAQAAPVPTDSRPASEAATAVPASPAEDTIHASIGVPWVWVVLAGIVMAEIAIVAAIIMRRIRRRRRRLAWVRLRALARRRQHRCDIPAAVVPPKRHFEVLKQASFDDMATLLADQSAETVALALIHMSPSRAARLLARFGGTRQVQVARCMAVMDRIDPDTLAQAERRLAERLTEDGQGHRRRQGGISAVARVLKHSGHAGRRNVLEALARQDPRLAESISRQLFTFGDIVDLPADRLATTLADASPDDLAIALRTASDDLKERLLAAIEPQVAETVEARMQDIGPVRLGDIEDAQRRIVEAIGDCDAADRATAVREGQVMA